MSILNALNTPTPQSEPLNDRQAPNNAGGHSFVLGVWERLDRFLITGTDGGTYYVDERRHTLKNIAVVDEALAADPTRAIDRAVEVSTNGLAKKNDQALYVLAKAVAAGTPDVRKRAGEALQSVARTGRHIFTYHQLYDAVGGSWGRSGRRALGDLYARRGLYPADIEFHDGDEERARRRSVDNLAYQAIKYRNGDGYDHLRALRRSHPKTDDPERRAVFEFMKSGTVDDLAPSIIHSYAAVNDPDASIDDIVGIVERSRLPWEALPTKVLNNPKIMAALIEHMPVGATIRQLARYTRGDMLKPLSDVEALVVERLTDAEQIRKARVHPLAFLEAALVHASGGTLGLSRGKTYTPNQNIVAALEAGFHLAFQSVIPSGKRHYLAVDVSPSMGWPENRIGQAKILEARQAAAALLLVTAITEPRTHITAFAGEMVQLEVGKGDSVNSVITKTGNLRASRTDCAAPMLDAMNRGIEADCFTVFTDSETWFGNVHPSVALAMYRERMGIEARLVCVGMTATEFSIADPNDPGSLNVAGFSTDTPAVISRFASGDF